MIKVVTVKSGFNLHGSPEVSYLLQEFLKNGGENLFFIQILIKYSYIKYMTQLGSLEETILLLVLTLSEGEAYGVSIAEAYKQQMEKSISIPAVHTVLKRLESKELIESSLGEASRVRGGKRKRIYRINQAGYLALKAIHDNRSQLWQAAPKLSFSS